MDDPQIISARQPFLSLNLGHVLTIGSMLIGGAGAYYGMKDELHGVKSEMQNIDQRVSRVETALTQLTNIAIMTARQDEKLISIERRLDKIEHATKP